MLTDRLNGVFKKLRNRGRLSESNIDDAMREVRRALLEADVNYKVARSFIARVKDRALGASGDQEHYARATGRENRP